MIAWPTDSSRGVANERLARRRQADHRRGRESVPEDADRIFGQLAEQLAKPTTGSEQRIALPPSRVPVVVKRPKPLGGDVAQPGNRQPRPLRPGVLTPRRSALDDRHRLAFLLKLDADLAPGARRHSSLAQLANPRHIAVVQHERHPRPATRRPQPRLRPSPRRSSPRGRSAMSARTTPRGASPPGPPAIPRGQRPRVLQHRADAGGVERRTSSASDHAARDRCPCGELEHPATRPTRSERSLDQHE